MESVPEKLDRAIEVMENIRDLLEMIVLQDINKPVVKLVMEDDDG